MFLRFSYGRNLIHLRDDGSLGSVSKKSSVQKHCQDEISYFDDFVFFLWSALLPPHELFVTKKMKFFKTLSFCHFEHSDTHTKSDSPNYYIYTYDFAIFGTDYTHFRIICYRNNYLLQKSNNSVV